MKYGLLKDLHNGMYKFKFSSDSYQNMRNVGLNKTFS